VFFPMLSASGNAVPVGLLPVDSQGFHAEMSPFWPQRVVQAPSSHYRQRGIAERVD